ncbi:MAG: amino acid ABC transporter substrate-binding protein [Streptomycetaceae bacterium]|nr:MAG: amino acid ABC transporter substrate-binding protein [Streptomycetaceae bacterium]
MMRKVSKIAFGTSLLLVAISLTACSAQSSSTTETAAACSAGALPTLTSGVISIGTDDPAYDPWFSNNDPSNAKGFESAVAYAVAKELGYPADKVVWIKAPFNTVIQPGTKPFDFDINQVSITAERANAVDFSSGYYDVAQAVVTIKGSKIANAKSIADLANAKLGAAVGTTSYSTITDIVKPKTDAAVFDSNDIAKQSLSNGSIDGLVVDLPTAFYIAAVDLTGGLIVGQFAPQAGGEQFGLVLSKGSSLTSCVTKAVDTLRSNGTLQTLADTWLATSVGAPVLK